MAGMTVCVALSLEYEPELIFLVTLAATVHLWLSLLVDY